MGAVAYGLRQQNAKRGECRLRLESMITGCCALPTVAAAGEWPYLDGCLGIQGDP